MTDRIRSMGGMYAGLFLTSFAALMMELLLTRIFSVATWYYFAFFAISVAMFGFTVGALAVYVWKDFFSDEALRSRMTMFALLFGVAADVSLLVFLSIPFYPRFTGVGIFSTILIYLVISAPFAMAGVVVCLCLTRMPEKTGLLYAADLAGAGIGAFMVFPVLNAMDAPTGIFLVGATAALGAIFFSRGKGAEAWAGEAKASTAPAAVFLLLTAVMLVNYLYAPVRVEWVKTLYNEPQVEAWNAFSRIAVYPARLVRTPYSWGLSRSYVQNKFIGEKMIDIDGGSETVMTFFDGNLKDVDHLKYDVTAVAHYLKDNAKVFIIGVGGGRDILAAKLFGASEIVGAEINNRTIELMTGPFGEFTGHLDKLPGVKIINDEARSAITRMDDKFDLIQASCIATWSSTSAGAYTLTENTLYTAEAWKIFYDHLKPDGVMSFNRWFSRDYPAQLLRMTSLAAHTLKKEGVKNPARHIAIIRSELIGDKIPSATIIVSKSPFGEEALKRLGAAVDMLKFKWVFSPDGYQHPLFREAIDRVGDAGFYGAQQLDLSPSTDDKPFFFYMVRLQDVFSFKKLKRAEQIFNVEGVKILFVLLGVSVFLSAVFIILPLYLVRKRAPLPAGAGAIGLLFFASIGFGYILIEIGQLQRLIIFLGHPIYSITVVIFAMLASSGAGAYASVHLTKRHGLSLKQIAASSAVLILLIAFAVFMQNGILRSFEGGSTAFRIFVSLLFLMPMGFLMGLQFPFGMSIASRSYPEHTPWFWAVNGATSVVSSVLSVCISITYGFTATLSAGLVFYVLAAVFLCVFYSFSGRALKAAE